MFIVIKREKLIALLKKKKILCHFLKINTTNFLWPDYYDVVSVSAIMPVTVFTLYFYTNISKAICSTIFCHLMHLKINEAL